MSARAYLPPEPPEFLRAPRLEQRDGGDVIDTRLHRAAPIQPPRPSDTEISDWLTDAQLADMEADAELMRWTRKDSAMAAVVFVAAIAAAACFPGMWFAGWLK